MQINTIMNKISLAEIRKDYQENKADWDKMLAAGTKAKYDACTINGKFDYLKMAEMYHAGKW